MAIFSDLIEKDMEVFMDDFLVYGKTFEECLENLDKVLKRCQEANLVLMLTFLMHSGFHKRTELSV